jgi:hypothetical protein
MSLIELQKHRREALDGMFAAKDKVERAVWMTLHRWVVDEIKKHWCTTAMVSNAK